MSFYKEELEGEKTNQISTLAACTNKSKLDTFTELTETTIRVYNSIIKILEGSPEACKAFKHYAVGFIRSHTSVARYRLQDLDL